MLRKEWKKRTEQKNFQNFRLNQNLILCCNPQNLILQHIPLKNLFKHSQVPNEVELPLRLHCSAQSLSLPGTSSHPSLTFILPSPNPCTLCWSYPLKNYTAATKAPKTHTRASQDGSMISIVPMPPSQSRIKRGKSNSPLFYFL